MEEQLPLGHTPILSLPFLFRSLAHSYVHSDYRWHFPPFAHKLIAAPLFGCFEPDPPPPILTHGSIVLGGHPECERAVHWWAAPTSGHDAVCGCIILGFKQASRRSFTTSERGAAVSSVSYTRTLDEVIQACVVVRLLRARSSCFTEAEADGSVAPGISRIFERIGVLTVAGCVCVSYIGCYDNRERWSFLPLKKVEFPFLQGGRPQFWP